MKYLFTILTLMLLVIGVNAANCGDMNLTSNPSVYSIEWTYHANEGITGMSLDGRTITNFDNQSGYYILNRADGEGTTTHTLRITNETDSACNTSAFLPTPKTESETFFTTINLWILFIIALACIVVGISVPIIAICGAVFCIVGIVGSFNNSFALGFVFFIGLIASLIVGLTQ